MAVEYNMQEALATTYELVDKKLRKQYEQETLLLNEWQKVQKDPTNQRGRRYPINTSPNASINWRLEGGQLPKGGTHKSKEFRIFYARPAIARRLTGDVLDLDSQDTLLKALTDGMDMDYDTLKKEFNQQIYGDGSGRKGVVNGVSGSSITLKRPQGATQFLDGGNYQFYNPADGAARSATISVVAEGGVSRGTGVTSTVAGQVTFTASVPGGVVEDDEVAWAGSYLNSLTGLKKLVSDANEDIQGVDRAVVSSVKSPNIDANGAFLGLSLIDQQELQVGIKAGAANATSRMVIVTSYTQYHRYRDLGRNYQYYMSGQKWDGNYGGIDNMAVNGHKIWRDVDCDEDRFYLLDFAYFVTCELAPLGLMDKDGNRMRMIPAFDTSGEGTFYDANIYFLGAKFDIGLLEPRRCSCITELATDGLVHPHFN